MLAHWLQSLMPLIQHLSGWIYWIALLAALVETVLVIGLFLPGSSMLLLLGALAASPDGPSFLGVLAFAVAGATLGDNINYSLGRRYGRRWAAKGLWLLRREHFERAQGFFARHGGKSVFLSRFVPSLKEVAPFVAGTADMGHGWFFVWNLLGALGWGLQWVGAGYVFARSLSLAQLWLSRAGLGIALLALLLLLLWYLRRTMLRYWPQWWSSAVSVSRSLTRAIRDNPSFQGWAAAHPRAVRVLAERTDRGHFRGLPLTLLGTAFAYLLLLFGGLIEDVVTADPIVAVDHSLAELVAAVRTPVWVSASAWLSGLEAWPVVVASVAAAAVWLWRSGRRAYVLPLLASVGGSLAFAFVGKLVVHRARPAEAAIAGLSYAFPSAHATLAVSLYGLLAYVWIRDARNWPARVNTFFLWATVALLVGASRIVLGVHYLSDVLGGYLLGGLWLLLAVVWSEWISAHAAARPVGGARVTAPVALLAVGAVYLGTGLLAPPRLLPAKGGAVVASLPAPARSGLPDFLHGHLPLYVRTALGARAQPLSLVLIARDETALRTILEDGGWQVADRLGAAALWRLARQGLNDLEAPPAPLFWDGRLYTMAYNRSITSAAGTHELTLVLWRTPYRSPDGRLFVGVVRAYVGMHWYPARRLAPDLDAARERAAAQWHARGCVAADYSVPWVGAQTGQSFVDDSFFTRGRLRVIRLGDRCGGPP